MKVKGNLDKYYYYAFPMQAVIVTSMDPKGKTNPITIAWHTPISGKPPLYGISVSHKRYSHKLIKESEEFVVNFASVDLVRKVHFFGTRSGKNTDKLRDSGLTLANSQIVKTKIIRECYAHLECKLYQDIDMGDHTFFIGEVVNLVHNENALKENILDNKIMKPCYYLGNNTYTTIESKNKVF
jgi:flavin reductase (DIM6/NTAB) family NADH-FMN oxidoreductase RutF